MLKIVAITLLAAASLAASPAKEGKAPNLTGTWKLNVEQSEFGGDALAALTAVITDDGKNIAMKQTEVRRDGTTRVSDLKFDKTGKETVNQMGDVEMRTTMKVDGDMIRETSEFITPGGTLKRESTTSQSADGKTMTLVGVLTTPNGNVTIKMVLEKQ